MIIKSTLWVTAIDFAFLFLISYPMLYYSYKYYVPYFGGSDYLNYYEMYRHPLNFSVGLAPFVYRQVSAVLTNMVAELGIFYNTEISYSDPAHDPHIFFAAILVNYLSLLFSAILIMGTLRREVPRSMVWPLCGGFFLLFSFQALNHVITGLTEGVSWLLFTILFLLYRSGKRPVVFCAVMILSAFQRETISLVFICIAVWEIFCQKFVSRKNLVALISALASFMIYVAMRKIWFPAGGNENQLQPDAMASSIAHFTIGQAFIFQALLSQNILFIALIIAGVCILARISVTKEFQAIIVAFIFLAVLGISVGIGNNVGRVTGILVPALVLDAVLMLSRLDEKRMVAARADT